VTRGEGTVIIRAARRGDAEAIGRVYVETWRSSYAGILPDRALVAMSRRTQRAAWSPPIAARGGSEFMVVAEDREAGVVGFGSGGPSRAGLPYGGEIYTLYVLPDYQGRGLGRALLAALYDEFLARGTDSALIWVLAANPSRFFYEAMGGQRVAERQEVLWGARHRELAYGWPDLARATGPGGPCSPQ
jgi:GNAT superfamily N-acetyltransferase